MITAVCIVYPLVEVVQNWAALPIKFFFLVSPNIPQNINSINKSFYQFLLYCGAAGTSIDCSYYSLLLLLLEVVELNLTKMAVINVNIFRRFMDPKWQPLHSTL